MVENAFYFEGLERQIVKRTLAGIVMTVIEELFEELPFLCIKIYVCNLGQVDAKMFCI